MRDAPHQPHQPRQPDGGGSDTGPDGSPLPAIDAIALVLHDGFARLLEQVCEALRWGGTQTVAGCTVRDYLTIDAGLPGWRSRQERRRERGMRWFAQQDFDGGGFIGRELDPTSFPTAVAAVMAETDPQEIQKLGVQRARAAASVRIDLFHLAGTQGCDGNCGGCCAGSTPVLARDRGCRFPACGRTAVQVHHIVPRSKGGTHSSDNLIGACALHHLRYVHKLGWQVSLDPVSGLVTWTNTRTGTTLATRPNGHRHAPARDPAMLPDWLAPPQAPPPVDADPPLPDDLLVPT